MADALSIHIRARKGWLRRLNPILGGGFGVAASVGCSIRDVLCGQFGVDGDYLDQRVQTVFLNGQPVDDVDTAVVDNEAVLSLSAAMPGLAGATLRKGGHYAALRQSISYSAAASRTCRRNGRITIKLFNMVARELGPGFLEKGVRISAEDACQVFRSPSTRKWDGVASIEVDGQETSADQLAVHPFDHGDIVLTVTVIEDDG